MFGCSTTDLPTDRLHHDGSVHGGRPRDGGLDGSPSDGDGDGDGGGGSNGGGGGNVVPDAGPTEVPAGTVIHDPTCGDFTVPQNTYATFDAPLGERRIVLHCTPGTLPSGPMGSICRAGVWSRPVGACYYPTYTDPTTGNEWAAFPSASILQQGDAFSYCLGLDASQRWAVPTTAELLTLLDLEGGTLLYRNPGAFPVEDRDKILLTVDYFLGFKEGYGPTGNYNPFSAYVRCVKRGSFQRPSFHDNGDGTITDSTTGLVWQKGFDAHPPTTAEGAAQYCRSLGLPGEGWRVPTIRELASILDFTSSATHALDYGSLDSQYFPRGQQAALSSTPIPGMPGHTYYVSWYGDTAFRGIFGNMTPSGQPDPDVSLAIGVRCVR